MSGKPRTRSELLARHLGVRGTGGCGPRVLSLLKSGSESPTAGHQPSSTPPARGARRRNRDRATSPTSRPSSSGGFLASIKGMIASDPAVLRDLRRLLADEEKRTADEALRVQELDDSLVHNREEVDLACDGVWRWLHRLIELSTERKHLLRYKADLESERLHGSVSPVPADAEPEENEATGAEDENLCNDEGDTQSGSDNESCEEEEDEALPHSD